MRKMGIAALAVIIVVAGIAACYWWRTQAIETKAEQAAAKEKAANAEVMEALAAKYDTLRDWEKLAGIATLDTSDPYAPLRPVYSIDLQRVLLDSGKPALMVMSLDDVARRGDSFFARFTQPIGALMDDSLVLELACSQDQARTLTQERPVAYGQWAVVASVRTLDRPKVIISSNNGEIYIEASSSVFLGTGILIDFVYMGDLIGDAPGH
ncbi:MAG: hypothetical protein ACYC9Q_08390 [Bacillota bacterium]